MLDLTKLARQMQGISQHLTLEAAASRQRLERAQQFFIVAKTQQAELVQRVKKGQYIYYSLNTTVVDEIIKWFVQLTRQAKNINA